MYDIEEHNKLLSLLGLALLQAQALEYSIVSLYAINKILADGNWTKDIRNLMKSKYKQTLGKLLKDISKKINFKSDLESRLFEALKLRNWVVHRYFREFGPVVASDILRDKAIKKLYRIALFFEQVSDEINEINFNLMQQCGKSGEDIVNSINKAIKSYLDEKEKEVECP